MGKAVKAQIKAVQKPTTTKAPTGLLQRKCDRCREKEKILQRSAVSSVPATVPPIVHEVLRWPRAPLEEATRDFMKTRFAHDFSQIPVHSRLPASIQAKLTINAPGDIHEQEADRIADQVMAAPARDISSTSPRIQRLAESSSGQTVEAPASVDRALAISGRALESGLRQEMEGRFGYDFSEVRVVTGTAAEQSARDVNAKAYTVGRDIVFGAGQFLPGTLEGRRLIVHELTHVMQQSGGDGFQAASGNRKAGLIPLSTNRFGEMMRKVNYLKSDMVETDPVTTVLDNPFLALTTPVINGSPLPQPVIRNNKPDYTAAANIIFPLFNQLYIDHKEAKSLCKVKEPEINCSARISILQKPTSRVWQGSAQGTRFQAQSATCANVNNVTVYIKGKSGADAISVYNKVLANEMEHVDDLNRCAKKHFETYIVFLNNFSKQITGKKETEDKQCQEAFLAYVGNKDSIMIQAFLSELSRLVGLRDKKGGPHDFSPTITVDGKDCFTVVIKI